MPHLLVLLHGPTVGLERLARVVEGRSEQLPVRRVDLDAGDELPPLDDDVGGVLCMGGEMDWDDADPWLAPERQLLADAVEAGVPVLGVCLGAQQLAVALGGQVAPLPRRNGAVPDLVRTPAGRDHDVFAGWPDGSPALFHNADSVVRRPEGSVLMLDGSPVTPAAWADATDTALAVQFHPEVSPSSVTVWVDRVSEMVAAGEVEPPYDREAFLARVTEAGPWISAAGLALVARWLDVRVLPRA